MTYPRKENGKIKYYYKCIESNECFDVFQIIKHILGIYNGRFNTHKEKYRLEPAKNIQLIIGYWTIPDENNFFVGDKNLTEHKKYCYLLKK